MLVVCKKPNLEKAESMTESKSEFFLTLEHVSKFYGSVIGVGDLNLELKSGAYGLVGPNGSGKTTLINLITGALAPSIGRVEVFGTNPHRNRSVLRDIGLCPASDIYLPNVSALQWVEYLTSLHGYTKKEAYDRAVESLVRVGMGDAMRRPIGSYSLGMRQRAKLAQATAHDPNLLILDEPFNGLDPIARHELTDFLNDWVARGKCLLLASHILHEVEAITSAFLLIHGGRILASGEAAEVRSMLRAFPVEVRLTGTGLQKIATELMGETWLSGASFSEDKNQLTVSVSDKGAFQDRIAKLACLPEVEIVAVESPDGSLESAFDLLLNVHRGELML